MKKSVRYGLLLLAVFIICMSLIILSSQPVYANEEEEVEEEQEDNELTEEDIYEFYRDKAISDANRAIFRITNPDLVIGYEEAFMKDVAKAISLVEYAKDEYDAEDSDFDNLAKLHKAETKALKFLSIRAARDAIDKIPPLDQITSEHREIIEEARRLVLVAIQEHGATPFQICWRLEYLEDAEDRLPEEEEPKPKPKPDDRKPTPPTGGVFGVLAAGLVMTGSGLLYLNTRRKGRH